MSKTRTGGRSKTATRSASKDAMRSTTSSQSLAGVKLSSDFTDDTAEWDCGPERLSVSREKSNTGFSYKALPDKGPFASKKGQPIKITPAGKINGSIQLLGHRVQTPPDERLIDVYRFETNVTNFQPNEPAKRCPSNIPDVQYLFPNTDRDINEKLKVLTGPALGRVCPSGEGHRSAMECESKVKKIRKYRHGVAPLEKLAVIEDELDKVIERDGHNLSDTYHKIAQVRHPPADLSPNLTKSEYDTIRKQIFETKESRKHRNEGKNEDLPLALNDGKDMFKPNASITITVPMSDIPSAEYKSDHSTPSDQENLKLFSRQNNNEDEEEEEEEEEEFLLADFNTPRSEDERAVEEERRRRRAEKIQQYREKMRNVRERNFLRTVRKDPDTLPKQLPRAQTGEYLAKDYATRKYDHLFKLNDYNATTDSNEYQPSFQQTKNKLLSKKDKVFLKGSNEAIDIHVTMAEEEFISPSTDISVECQSTYGPPLAVDSMPSRYKSGRETLSEKKLSGKPHEVPGFIRTMVMKKEEAARRMRCFACQKDATYWCAECAKNYCTLCWNSIGHHENIVPDQVWNNRRPLNAIENNPNDERGTFVFLCQNEIHQGVTTRVATPHHLTRPKSPPLQKLDFPPPDGLEGFHTYRGDYDWNTISKKRVRYKGNRSRREKLGEKLLRAPGYCEVLHNLDVAPPLARAPPGMSQENSPVLKKSPSQNSPSNPPSPLLSPTNDNRRNGNDTPNDSVSNVSPNNSSGQNYNHSPIGGSTIGGKKKELVVLDALPKQTLIWQVAPTGRTLCPVSSLTPSKYSYPARGITSEFFPEEWKHGREKIHRNVSVYNGVTVITCKLPHSGNDETGEMGAQEFEK